MDFSHYLRLLEQNNHLDNLCMTWLNQASGVRHLEDELILWCELVLGHGLNRSEADHYKVPTWVVNHSAWITSEFTRAKLDSPAYFADVEARLARTMRRYDNGYRFNHIPIHLERDDPVQQK